MLDSHFDLELNLGLCTAKSATNNLSWGAVLVGVLSLEYLRYLSIIIAVGFVFTCVCLSQALCCWPAL
jgi:hypothetical protein